MICAAIKGPTYNEAIEQITHVLPFADMIELRLDLFESIDIEALRALMERFEIPIIFTLRSLRQGGSYPHSEKKRLENIQQIATLNPHFLDIEFDDVPEKFITDLTYAFPSIKLILSYHNFNEIPKDLDALLASMQTIPAYWYKLAVYADNAVKAIQFLLWGADKPNTITVCMGKEAQFTRILAPIFNIPLTYAALDEDHATAPGQLSAKELVERYNYKSITPNTRIYALIGDPVNKSVSDQTHNYVFNQCELDAVYVKIPLDPQHLEAFLALAPLLPFLGLSVTMPLKEHILPLVYVVNKEVSFIGAVNTLTLKANKYYGTNTDGCGALNALERHLSVEGKHIVILGAGGAAKAILYESIKRKAQVTVVNRTVEKAEKLAEQYNCGYSSLDDFSKVAENGYDIIINTTPDSMPIQNKDLLEKKVAMDIKTRPQYSDFLNFAHSKNCTIVFGYEMFVEQAIGQYNVWFNNIVTEDECRKLLYEKTLKALYELST